MGLKAHVYSGGQPHKGSGLPRIGSTRHDGGMAGDMWFTKDGRKLDMRRPADQALLYEVVRRSKEAGLTGFGAGESYMGPHTVHLGYGKGGHWGSGPKGYKSIYAPDWLSAAVAGRPFPGQSSQGGAPESGTTPQPVSNPNMPPPQQDQRRKRLAQLVDAAQNPNFPKNMRNSVMGMVLAEAMKPPPDPMVAQKRALEVQKLQGEIQKQKDKRSEASRADQERAKQSRGYARNVMGSIDDAFKIMEGTTTGTGAEQTVMRGVPWPTDRERLNGALDTIRANVGFNRLQEMREASPTGGALGQVSEMENRLLQSTIASLDPGQGVEVMRKNLGRVKKVFFNTIHGSDEQVFEKLGPEYENTVAMEAAKLIKSGVREDDAFNQAMLSVFDGWRFGR